MAKDRPVPTRATWPAISYERRPWDLDDRVTLSRTQRRAHQGPYDAAVVPRVARIDVDLPASLLAESEDARVGIARFDAYVSAQLDHGDSAREIGPLASILLRTEAASSSQIEQITVGALQLAVAELGERASDHARVVARNVAIMRAATAMADGIETESILQMHRTLLAEFDADNAGHWRTQQVWVGGSGAGPHLADFVPPHHSHVLSDMADLVAFMARDDIPALAHAALAHAQFETIHPFTDGNGRTGRALLHAMLRAKGVTERVTVPVSAGLLTDTARYFTALTAYRAGDTVPIVREISRASMLAIDNGRELIEQLVDIRAGWTAQIKARSDAAVWRLPELLMRHPVVNNETVRRELGLSDVAAQRAIDTLTGIGALAATKSGSRNRLWHSPEILQALDDFSARAGRRGIAS